MKRAALRCTFSRVLHVHLLFCKDHTLSCSTPFEVLFVSKVSVGPSHLSLLKCPPKYMYRGLAYTRYMYL